MSYYKEWICQARGFSADNTCDEELDKLDSYSKTELNGISYIPTFCFVAIPSTKV